jgi:vacuolar-type H+-ATPase subunit F/Vma7
MDGVPVVLTERLAAAAWRLAGAQVRIVEPREVAAAFDEACASAPLVLVDAALAAALEPDRLARARRAVHPLVLVVPSLRGTPAEHAVPDAAASLRRALGVVP